MEVFLSLAVAWAKQKWPKMWKLARNGREDKNGHILSQEEHKKMGWKAVMVTKQIVWIRPACDSASLNGFALIFTCDTDKTRYVVKQLKIKVLIRYDLFYNVSQ